MNEPGTRSHAPHEPGAVVPCPVRQDNLIATSRCVEYQLANGCHCRFAFDSIKRVEQLFGDMVGDGFDEDLDLQAHKEEVRRLRERAEEIEKARPPPAMPPAQEGTMADQKTCSKCGWRLRADNMKGVCGDAAACRRRPAKEPGAAEPGAPPLARANAQAGDVVQLLEGQLAHHRSQAEKIEKALEVLR